MGSEMCIRDRSTSVLCVFSYLVEGGRVDIEQLGCSVFVFSAATGNAQTCVQSHDYEEFNSQVGQSQARMKEMTASWKALGRVLLQEQAASLKAVGRVRLTP